MAERVGFEPTVPCGTHAFQACALSHSAISPCARPFMNLAYGRGRLLGLASAQLGPDLRDLSCRSLTTSLRYHFPGVEKIAALFQALRKTGLDNRQDNSNTAESISSRGSHFAFLYIPHSSVFRLYVSHIEINGLKVHYFAAESLLKIFVRSGEEHGNHPSEC
jgi:hypothetical protein